MDLIDAHMHCPGCLGTDHLKEALTDPCTECSLMSLEIRQQRMKQFNPGSEDCLTPVKTRTQVTSAQLAKLRDLQKKETSSDCGTISTGS